MSIVRFRRLIQIRKILDREKALPLSDLWKTVYFRLSEDDFKEKTRLPRMRQSDAYLQKDYDPYPLQMFTLSGV